MLHKQPPLTEEELDIIYSWLVLGVKQRDIAAAFMVTPARICQLAREWNLGYYAPRNIKGESGYEID